MCLASSQGLQAAPVLCWGSLISAEQIRAGGEPWTIVATLSRYEPGRVIYGLLTLRDRLSSYEVFFRDPAASRRE